MVASVDYKYHRLGEPTDQSICELFDLASMEPLYNHYHRIHTPSFHNDYIKAVGEMGNQKTHRLAKIRQISTFFRKIGWKSE